MKRKRSGTYSRIASLCMESLEMRHLLSLIAPSPVSSLIEYTGGPTGVVNNTAIIQWTDTNIAESGYRVKFSPDAVSNWTALPDVPSANPANVNETLQTTQIVLVGEKNFYRVFAYDASGESPGSAIFSPETSIDRAVQLTATVSSTGNGSPMVDVIWQPISPYSPAIDQPTSYTLYSRELGDAGANWVTVDGIGAGETDYVDFPTSGNGWEYKLKRHDAGGHDDYGYVSVQNGDSLPGLRGTVLLVIDESQLDPISVGADNAAAMGSKLDRLAADMVGDGWSVQSIPVPRDDDSTVARTDVSYVKQQIMAVYATHPDLKSIFLIGHVPVPYSGIYTSYDGHPNHYGAWPADVYYGDMDGGDMDGNWGDEGYPNGTASGGRISITGSGSLYASFPDNYNLPHDGKFDWSVVPPQPDGSTGKVELAVGRVDFARLDWYGQDGTTPISESFLLQRYLDKDHAFRTGSLDFVPLDSNGNPLPNKAIIDDEFGPGPGFGIGDAWSNLSALVGSDHISSARWNASLQTTNPADRYLWAFGAGPGAINDGSQHPGDIYQQGFGQPGQAGRIAQNFDYAGGPYSFSTDPFAGDLTYQAVFNVMFGSWIGDWNYPRSLLRSAVASNGIALASMWGERPTWFLQSMGAGATLGDVFLTTINNSSDAANGYIGGTSSASSYDHSIAIALMGDPTLRMTYAKPPTWATGSFLDEFPRPTWDASGGFDHFNVYRSTSSDGPFTLIGSTTDSHYFDVNLSWDPNSPTYYYMIRGVTIQQTPTGSYENESTGVSLALPNDTNGAVSDYAVYNLYQGSQTFSQDLYETLSPQVVFTLFPGTSATFSATQHLFALNISDGAQATMPTGTGVLVTGTLSIDTGGTLDLADNDMIVLDGDAGTWDGSAYTGITGLVAQGRNGGSWDGTGIISSDASTTDDLTMLAVVAAKDPFNLSGTQTATFDGETVTATSVIVKFTYGGDANIDGHINVDDYGRIDSEVGQSGTVFGWYNGDFNYDGVINIDDYGIIDGNIGAQGAPL